MGIKIESIEKPEDVKEDEIFENDQIVNPSGTYNMTGKNIGWSLNLPSGTVTVNITNRPEFPTKVIDKNNPVAEYRQDDPWYQSFLAKVSADFDLNQIVLNGYATYLTGDPRPGKRWGKNRYENVIVTSW